MVLVLVAVCGTPAAIAAPKPSPLRSPFDTDLRAASSPAAAADERITVTGRSRARLAPLPDYAGETTPWDAARAIRDPRTGTDTTRFGDAYNLGSVLGSDERSNETGGIYIAPRHQED